MTSYYAVVFGGMMILKFNEHRINEDVFSLVWNVLLGIIIFVALIMFYVNILKPILNQNSISKN